MAHHVAHTASGLALYGGPPVRTAPFPGRRLFDEAELQAVTGVFRHAWETGRDFGYQGPFEDAYMRDFCTMQGGGHADAVSSGTASVLLALAALDLPPGSEVACSPVTDPGGVTPILALGLKPVVVDAAPGGFNMGADELAAVITPRTRAVLVTHVGGIPAGMERIAAVAGAHGLAVAEDCSQAHGARINGTPVGNFGDIAAFSTMFSKNHASGGCGGIVHTRRADLHRRVRALADRGKPFMDEGFDPRNPGMFLFPALNFNQDELSCAIGRSTLARLPHTITRRQDIVRRITEGLADSTVLSPLPVPSGMESSPFFLTVRVATHRLRTDKLEFARAVQAEGIPLNPDYRYVLAEWPWLAPHCATPPHTPNASSFRQQSFNLLFHERFSDADADDIVTALLKVEAALAG